VKFRGISLTLRGQVLIWEQIIGKRSMAEVLVGQAASKSVPLAIRPMSRKRDTTRRPFS
jgi:hypothetical protein